MQELQQTSLIPAGPLNGTPQILEANYAVYLTLEESVVIAGFYKDAWFVDSLSTSNLSSSLGTFFFFETGCHVVQAGHLFIM